MSSFIDFMSQFSLVLSWHPSSDLHENFCAGSQYIDLITILGLSTLIKQIMTSNDPLMNTNDLNSKCD